MESLIIESNESLRKWLIEFDDFRFSCLLSLDPLPSQNQQLPAEVAFELAKEITWNSKAYSENTSRVFHFTASGVSQFEMSPCCAPPVPGYKIGGIDVFDRDSPISFQIDTPSELTLACHSLTIQELDQKVDVVSPAPAEDVFCVSSSKVNLVTPTEWVEKFRQQGQNVAWFDSSLEPWDLKSVPLNYSVAWSIQIPEEHCDSNQGITFSIIRFDQGPFFMFIRREGVSSTLWSALKQILATLENVTISSGNCQFTAEEWRRELIEKKILRHCDAENES